MTSAHLTLLGAPYLTVDGARVALSRKKALALLAYLAVTRTTHTRDSLAALLWGDSDDQSSHAYLRNALWTLNKALGASWALTDSGTVGLNPAYPLRVDVTEFTGLAQHIVPDSAVRTVRTEYILSVHHLSLMEALSQAAALYTGAFMTGFSLSDCPEFEQWQTLTAGSLQRTAHGVFKAWTDSLSQAGQTHAALDAAQRWVGLDPLHEPAQRALIRLYADAGESATALRQYRDFSRLLHQELRAQPDSATVALYNTLLSPTPSAAASPSPSAATVRTEYILSAQSASQSPAAEITPPDPLMGSGVHPLTQQTYIVGRETERTDLLALLKDPFVRLITITGAGGMGKTRLSEQVGVDAFNAGLFPDGAYFISLTPLCSADAIAPTLINALPFPVPRGIDSEHVLRDMLRGQRTLLVIDNCEHLLEGVALFSRVLESAPDVKILATSRERLTLRNERTYELRGLPLPVDSQSAQASPTVGLFVSHAQVMTPDFALTPDTVSAIARICRLVEGMPLAIELAAAWTPLLTPTQIAAEIQRSLDFLTTSARDVPERHRSLRAVFGSSWDYMLADEQMALARLSVFRGGFTVESASSVAGASLTSLLALLNKSLLKRGRQGRFEIHELLRQFADSYLTPDDRAEARTRHARYFAAYIQGQLPRLLSAEQPAAMETLQDDIDNLRAAIQHTTATADAPTLAHFIDPIGLFYAVATRYDDFGELFQSAADAFALRPQTDEVRVLTARLILRAATIKRSFSHQSVIDGMAARAAALLEPYTDRFDTAIAWIDLGTVVRRTAYVAPQCVEHIRRGLALFQQIGYPWGIAYALFQLGTTLHMQIQYEEARKILHQALTMFEGLGQPLGLLQTLDMLAENYFTTGDYAASDEYLARQVAYFRALGLHQQAQHIEQKETRFYTQNSRLPSDAVLEKSLNIAREAGDRRNIAWTLYNLGWMKWYHYRYADALFHLTEAMNIFKLLGDEEGTIWTNIFTADCHRNLGDWANFERYIAGARAAIGDIRFPWGEAGLEFVLGDAALSRGQMDEAIEHFRTAVKIAHGVQSIMQTLRHLCGIADAWAHAGRTTDAMILCQFLLHHQATWDDTLRRARVILTRIEAQLPIGTSPDSLRTEAEAMSIEQILGLIMTD